MNVRRGRPPKLRLEPEEAELLTEVVGQLVDLFSDDADSLSGEDTDDPLARMVGMPESGEPASDPVTRRLLPDAYQDDESATEWRRLGRSEVRQVKCDAATLVLADCGQDDGHVVINLDDEHLTAWLAVLTDLRLSLAVRLDITEDWVEQARRLPFDDPRRPAFAIYEWLSVMQSEIIETVDR